MRKHIFCAALLSLLAVLIMPLSALAASSTVSYYKLTSVTPSSRDFHIAGSYVAVPTLAKNDTVKLTFEAEALYRSYDATPSVPPSGYNTTATITWIVEVSPSSANGDASGSNKLSIDGATAFTATALKQTGTLVGKINAPCTITVKATQGSNSKTAAKVKINPVEKPAPTMADDKTKNSTQLIGMLGAVPALGADTAKYASATRTINPAAGLGTVLTFENYPEYITITPSASELSSKYGITVTDSKTNPATFTAATGNNGKRTLTFGGTAANIVTPTPEDGEEITIKVWNIKVDGKTESTKREKEITLRLYAYAPIKFDTDGGKQNTTNNSPTKGLWDLGYNATTKTAVPSTHKTLAGLQMVKANVTFGESAVWKTNSTKISTPALYYAKNLPDGLKLVMNDTTQKTAKAAQAEVNAHLEGTPTKPGYYKDIKIILSNDGGVWSNDYVMDIVAVPEITSTKLPDLTWGQNYTATLTATGGENSYHPISFDFQTNAKGPGIKFTDTVNGILSGKLTSSDAQLTAASLSDYVLGDAKEKEVTLKLKVMNDYTGTAADKGTPANVTLKIKGVAPTLDSTKENSTAIQVQNAINKAELAYNKAISFKPLFAVKGPGTISIEFNKFPEGIDLSTAVTTDKSGQEVEMTGAPTITTKNHEASIKISNGAGSLNIPLKLTIGAEEADFKVISSDRLKPVKIGTEVTPVYLEAEFGPVKWKAKDLPSGLSLSIDKSVSYDKRVYIVGTPKSATKVDKNGKSLFTVTATNPPTGYEYVVSDDYRIFATPRITTTSLPTINAGKEYNAKISGTGAASRDLLWSVTIADYTPTNTALPPTRGILDSKDNTLTKTFKSAKAKLANQSLEGVSTLIVSADPKTGMPTITGSLDRIPASGRIKVTVKATVGKGTAAAETVSRDMLVNVRGTAVKVTTSKIGSFSRTDTKVSHDVIATGTLPIEMRAYITAKDAQSLLNLETENEIDLSKTDSSNPTGIKFVYDAAKKNGKARLESTGTGKYSFKNLPIHIEAGNAVSYNSKTGEVEHKSVDKSFKVVMPGNAVVWKYDSKAASPDMTFFGEDNSGITDIVYTASADLPYKITVSPAEKNGIKAEITQAEGTTPGKVEISGTPTKGKETKTTFTLTIQNTATKEKAQVKVNVIGMLRPEVTTKATNATKVIEVGKSLNFKVAAKGSRMSYYSPSKDKTNYKAILATKDVAYTPLVWEITDNSTNTSADLVKLGLSFDVNSGTFKGTAKYPTSDDSGKYSPYKFTVAPKNNCTKDADANASITVTIGVKGKKPRINTAAITLYRESDDQYELEKNQLKTNLTNDEGANITWAWAAGSDAKTNWGFGDITTEDNIGTLAGTLKKATKGVNLKVSADNIGQEQVASIKFIIRDADPEIDGDDTITFDGAKDTSSQGTGTFKIKEQDKMMTGDTKMQWRIVRAPNHSKLRATIKPSSDGTECVVTVTASKGVSPDIDPDKTNMVISVTNLSSKVTATKTIGLKVNGYTEALPADKDALPEDETELAEEKPADETVSGDEAAEVEGTVTYGEARGEDTLTQSERTALSEGGYIIAAILPEITADESGQYDLEMVSLDEAAPEGAELVWFAFPRGVESSDDDLIIEFYDEAGAEITAVPESRKVVPAPWLEKDVTYAPVIAVKAPAAGDAKDSLEEAGEGDKVTEQAIEEAAEKAAEETEETSGEAEKVSEESKHEEEQPSEAETAE